MSHIFLFLQFACSQKKTLVIKWADILCVNAVLPVLLLKNIIESNSEIIHSQFAPLTQLIDKIDLVISYCIPFVTTAFSYTVCCRVSNQCLVIRVQRLLINIYPKLNFHCRNNLQKNISLKVGKTLSLVFLTFTLVCNIPHMHLLSWSFCIFIFYSWASVSSR